VFGAFDRQFTDCVVLYHLGHTLKRLTELSEDVTTLAVAHNLHVNVTTVTSVAIETDIDAFIL